MEIGNCYINTYFFYFFQAMNSILINSNVHGLRDCLVATLRNLSGSGNNIQPQTTKIWFLRLLPDLGTFSGSKLNSPKSYYSSTLFAWTLSAWLISHDIIFFSHNKTASADLSAAETMSRTAQTVVLLRPWPAGAPLLLPRACLLSSAGQPKYLSMLVGRAWLESVYDLRRAMPKTNLNFRQP
jgi:hypothetical protein